MPQCGVLLDPVAEPSLIVTEAVGDEMRSRLLEALRDYAAERLSSGERMGLAQRPLEKPMAGPDAQQVLAQLEVEHGNLRAALTWCRQHNEADSGLLLASALWSFWSTRGYHSEGREWFKSLFSIARTQEPTAARARALTGAGVLAYQQGDLDEAQSCLAQNLSNYRELKDENGISSTLNNLGVLALSRGNYVQARTYYEESLAIYRATGDTERIGAPRSTTWRC